MKKSEFKNFVGKTLKELKLYAELHMDKSLPNDFELEWGFSKNENRFVGMDNVVDEITTRVFLEENRIYPCVDLVVKEISKENRILIGGRIASYEPREFGPNWTKRIGPYKDATRNTRLAVVVHLKNIVENEKQKSPFNN